MNKLFAVVLLVASFNGLLAGKSNENSNYIMTFPIFCGPKMKL